MQKFLLLLCPHDPRPSPKSPPPPPSPRRVDDHYNHLHSLQARYTERFQGLGLDRTETGTLTLLKPGRMRWAYDTPTGKLFLLDGRDRHRLHSQATPRPPASPPKQLDDLRSPLRFLLGHTELAKELDQPRAHPGHRHARRPHLHTLRNATQRPVSSGIHSLAAHRRLQRPDPSHAPRRSRRLHHHLHLHLRSTKTSPPRTADFTFTPPPGVTAWSTPRRRSKPI